MLDASSPPLRADFPAGAVVDAGGFLRLLPGRLVPPTVLESPSSGVTVADDPTTKPAVLTAEAHADAGYRPLFIHI